MPSAHPQHSQRYDPADLVTDRGMEEPMTGHGPEPQESTKTPAYAFRRMVIVPGFLVGAVVLLASTRSMEGG